jgi:hypothetical protein
MMPRIVSFLAGENRNWGAYVGFVLMKPKAHPKENRPEAPVVAVDEASVFEK